MKKIRKDILLLSIGFITLLVSCSPKVVSEQQMYAYLDDQENGLKKSQTVGGVQIEVTYRPTDLLVRQELFDNPTMEEVDSLRAHYGSYYYFCSFIFRQWKRLIEPNHR